MLRHKDETSFCASWCRRRVGRSFGGAAAGNLALTLGARGGVYIGGGIVQRIGDFLAASPFRDRFEDKGTVILLGRATGTFVQNGELRPDNRWSVPAAWRVVVERHPPLRTMLVWQDVERPLQVVRRSVDVPFEVLMRYDE